MRNAELRNELYNQIEILESELKEFTTHTGKKFSGETLQRALDAVAHDELLLGLRIYEENAYADHVSEELKIKELNDSVHYAAQCRAGSPKTFSFWQRLNMKLTGECIALFPKPPAATEIREKIGELESKISETWIK